MTRTQDPEALPDLTPLSHTHTHTHKHTETDPPAGEGQCSTHTHQLERVSTTCIHAHRPPLKNIGNTDTLIQTHIYMHTHTLTNSFTHAHTQTAHIYEVRLKVILLRRKINISAWVATV